MLETSQGLAAESGARIVAAPACAPPPLLAALQAALTDIAALRALIVVPGSGREGYTDSQVQEVARGTIERLQREHAEALARWRATAEVESSLPRPKPPSGWPAPCSAAPATATAP